MSSSSLDASALLPLAEALNDNPQPQATFAAVEALCRQRYGFRLFTILRNHSESGEIERVHSSNPTDYPLKGRKPMANTPWGAKVLEGGEVWLGNGAAAVEWAFPDAENILRLGCEACLCIPVRFAGRTLGIVSLNDAEDHYNTVALSELLVLAALLVPALLGRRLISTQPYAD